MAITNSLRPMAQKRRCWYWSMINPRANQWSRWITVLGPRIVWEKKRKKRSSELRHRIFLGIYLRLCASALHTLDRRIYKKKKKKKIMKKRQASPMLRTSSCHQPSPVSADAAGMDGLWYVVCTEYGGVRLFFFFWLPREFPDQGNISRVIEWAREGVFESSSRNEERQFQLREESMPWAMSHNHEP